MNEFVDFVNSYWFEFASLFFQFAILVTLVWLARYARRTLKAMRATHEQMETLKRLSLPDTITDRAFPNAAAERSFSSAAVERSMPSASEEQSFSSAISGRPVSRATEERPATAEGFIPAVPELAEVRRPRVAPLRGLIRWLRAPVRS